MLLSSYLPSDPQEKGRIKRTESQGWNGGKLSILQEHIKLDTPKNSDTLCFCNYPGEWASNRD
jgi:hypothetical protein